jgi:hypothetical protein
MGKKKLQKRLDAIQAVHDKWATIEVETRGDEQYIAVGSMLDDLGEALEK